MSHRVVVDAGLKAISHDSDEHWLDAFDNQTPDTASGVHMHNGVTLMLVLVSRTPDAMPLTHSGHTVGRYFNHTPYQDKYMAGKALADKTTPAKSQTKSFFRKVQFLVGAMNFL